MMQPYLPEDQKYLDNIAHRVGQGDFTQKPVSKKINASRGAG